MLVLGLKDLAVLLIVIACSLLINITFFNKQMGDTKEERVASLIITIAARALGWTIAMFTMMILGG
jgi:hypothetical protein